MLLALTLVVNAAPADAACPGDPPPEAPSGLQGWYLEGGAACYGMRITWSHQGLPATSFIVKNETTGEEFPPVAGSLREIEIHGLQPSTSYTFSIKARGCGDSAPANVSWTTAGSGCPRQPTNVQATQGTEYCSEISFEYLFNSVTPQGFKLYSRYRGEPATETIASSTTNLSVRLFAVDCGSTNLYEKEYAVVAYVAQGETEKRWVVGYPEGTPIPPGPPAAYFPIGNVGQVSTVRFRWDPASNARKFNLQIGTADPIPGSPGFQEFLDISSQESGSGFYYKDVTGLQPNVQYYWRLQSAPGVGNPGAWSAATAFKLIPFAIISPAGGEHWRAGSVQTVTWAGTGSMNIQASAGSGPWVTLASGVQGGSANVTMPAFNSTRAMIRVVNASSGASATSGGITVVGTPSQSWSSQAISLDNVQPSIALALGAGEMPNLMFAGTGAWGQPMFSRPHAGWWYPENPLNLNSGASNVSIAVDAEGTPHLSYNGVGGFHGYLTKVDGAWIQENVKPPWEFSSWYNSLRLSAQGVPHIARVDYYGRLIVSARQPGVNNGWVHPLTGVTSATYPSLAMNAQSDPRVSYTDTNGRLGYLERTGPSNWSSPVYLSAYGHAEGSSLAVDAQGNAKIAWFNPALQDLMYVERIGGVWSSPITLDSAGDTGRAPSLALDASGEPRVAYSGNGVLLYAVRNGGVWSISPADTSGNTGYASLALNEQGMPRIAYIDESAQRPRYAVSPADVVRPNDAQITVQFGTTTAVILWNAPGDDGASGRAAEYDLRYQPNGMGEFRLATRIPTSAPGNPGTQQAAAIDGLIPCGQAFSFALMTRDEAGNWGGSNTVMSACMDCDGGEEVTISARPGRVEGQQPPAALAFSLASSNPSREPVVFRLGVPEASIGAREELALFDLFGRRVRTIVAGTAAPGWRETRWDLRTESGSRARAGVYYARYHVGSQMLRQTIVIVE